MSEDKVEIDENEKELPSVEKSDQAINDNSETHIAVSYTHLTLPTNREV